MPRPTLYHQCDKALTGGLHGLLTMWVSADVSAPAIARLLHVMTGYEVSGQTVRRWLAELEDEEENGAAA